MGSKTSRTESPIVGVVPDMTAARRRAETRSQGLALALGLAGLAAALLIALYSR
jgi:hypothetical protein